MKLTTFMLIALLLIGCKNSQQSSDKDQTREEAHGQQNDKHSKHGKANEYMHQSSVQDLIKRFESPERDEYQQPQKVLEYLGDIQDQKIMDIGSGSGYFSVKLAARGAKVIAADVDDEFQAFIEKRIKENNLKNIETRKIPYDSPALKDQEVDKVFIVNTYHHIENRPGYFTKVRQGTKADGELIIIDFFKADMPVGPPVDHKIAKDKVIQELKMAGYTSFDINVDLLPYQYIIRAR
ncbi:class I SAM-dependent methyltransferase [Poritiphilus flavus]|uniref:Methyltransferase domain-containing protein n=1 Tax=Poritiphilus flavus TaxID=2697053 RepID=A0A6L9EGH0_9FLAO|nr:class I SAM-dependent methyltransferase [Poritiphilus flavus]NAS13847.1 methyltransferase domain-containing protein [Poritiphilus flavus]